jgi:DNA gyrase subunit A
MVTRNGVVKKTPLVDYATRLQRGIIAINLDDDDRLDFVFQTDGKKEIILASRQGLSVRFNESDVRPVGRNSRGMTGMRFKIPGDYIVGALAANLDEHVLTVSEFGLGKRSRAEDYRLTNRGTKGVFTLKVTEKTGELIALRSVKDDDELMIITARGIVIRQRVNTIRETGRVAQGVKLINLEEGDKVRAVAKILHDAEDDEDEASDASSKNDSVESEAVVDEEELALT